LAVYRQHDWFGIGRASIIHIYSNKQDPRHGYLGYKRLSHYATKDTYDLMQMTHAAKRYYGQVTAAGSFRRHPNAHHRALPDPMFVQAWQKELRRERRARQESDRELIRLRELISARSIHSRADILKAGRNNVSDEFPLGSNKRSIAAWSAVIEPGVQVFSRAMEAAQKCMSPASMCDIIRIVLSQHTDSSVAIGTQRPSEPHWNVMNVCNSRACLKEHQPTFSANHDNSQEHFSATVAEHDDGGRPAPDTDAPSTASKQPARQGDHANGGNPVEKPASKKVQVSQQANSMEQDHTGQSLPSDHKFKIQADDQVVMDRPKSRRKRAVAVHRTPSLTPRAAIFERSLPRPLAIENQLAKPNSLVIRGVVDMANDEAAPSVTIKPNEQADPADETSAGGAKEAKAKGYRVRDDASPSMGF